MKSFWEEYVMKTFVFLEIMYFVVFIVDFYRFLDVYGVV